MRALAILGCLALAACKTTGGPIVEPEVRVVQAQVEVPVPCRALEALGPEPSYPDTDAAIASAETIGPLAALYAAGRKLREQRLAEYMAARAACTF